MSGLLRVYATERAHFDDARQGEDETGRAADKEDDGDVEEEGAGGVAEEDERAERVPSFEEGVEALVDRHEDGVDAGADLCSRRLGRFRNQDRKSAPARRSRAKRVGLNGDE